MGSFPTPTIQASVIPVSDLPYPAWTICPTHEQIASVQWDEFGFESTNGPVVHGTAHCVMKHWWNVWGDAWVVLAGEEDLV